MIDYKYFTDFQKHIYKEYGYMLDKLNPSTSFWYFNARDGKKEYRSIYSHNYYLQYAKRFQEKRHTSLKILELGVYHGYSLLLWQKYFPNADIYGIDIDLSSSFRGKTPKELLKDKERIHLFEFDACDKKKVDEFVKENGADFDIIIEDGSHLGHHQILSTFFYLPLLKKDGIMVIEDIGLNYEADNKEFMIKNDNGTSMPIYEYFMLNYKEIKENVKHKLFPLTLDKDHINLLEQINIDWEAPVNKKVQFDDMDLQGRTLYTDFLGNSKLAFLTYKNKS